MHVGNIVYQTPSLRILSGLYFHFGVERMLVQNNVHGNDLIFKRMHFHTNSFAHRLVSPQRQKSTIHPWAGSERLWFSPQTHLGAYVNLSSSKTEDQWHDLFRYTHAMQRMQSETLTEKGFTFAKATTRPQEWNLFLFNPASSFFFKARL